MFLCDFHIHSRHSDGRLTIAQLVDLYGRQGFGAIAITDHLCETTTFLGKSARYLSKTIIKENFTAYLAEIARESARAMKQYQMLVIPGVEFTKNSFQHSDSAHIVALGLHQFVDPDLPNEEILKAIRHQGGVAIAAHPVATGKIEPQTYHLWHNRDRLASLFDAWEVASGPNIFHEVLESGLPMVASSDLHLPRQINSWKTVLDGPRTLAKVLSSIRSQDLNFTFYESPYPDWYLLDKKAEALSIELSEFPLLSPA